MATSGSLERQNEARESAIFKQTIRERTGEREEIHKKTFRKWINSKLAMAVPPLEVEDLIEEVRDGHVLLSLLEVLLGKPLKREKGRMRVHKLNNVTTALKLLEQNRVKLVGISNYDIVDGKSTPILGLIWSIILRFQVQGVMTGDDSGTSGKDFQVEKKLLSWCQTSLDGYEDTVNLKDFTTSWRDGLAFNAIIHTHKPELFRFESLLQNDNRTNLDHAFSVANEEFSVPKLLDPADIDVDKPDKKLVIMYLTSLYHGLREYSPQGRRKRRKLDDLADLEAYRAALKEVNIYISQVENVVSTKLETTSRFVNPQEEYKTSKDLKEDISNHHKDVEDVIDKGEAVMKSKKTDEIQCAEIKTEIMLLHERWEKLEILVQRLHKRCRGAVVSPREHQIDIYITWIKQMRREIAARGQGTDPADIKKEIKEHEEAIARIEKKVPEIDRVINEIDQLIHGPSMEDEDRLTLHGKLKDLNSNWVEMRTEALQKETDLQDKLSQSFPNEQNVETEVLVQVEQNDVESAPSEVNTLEIKPKVEHVVETQPNVHYLIDFEDGQGADVDQVDSFDKEAEKDAKLAKLQDKRNAVMLVLRNGSEKLENLRAKGAPNNLSEVKEQQNIIKECDSELKAGEPLLQDVILYERELMQDDLFDDKEKENITRDMAQLQEHYDDQRNFVDDEQEGLAELYEEMEKRNKIRDWEAERDDLNDKLDLCEEKLRDQEDQKPNEELLAAAKAFSEEVSALEPEVTRVIDSGNTLLESENLDADQKDQLVKDVYDVKDKYEDLKKKSMDEVMRLEDVVSREDTERTEKLDKWHEIKEKTSAIIVDSRSKLNEIKSKDPHTTPEIQEQLEEIQKCTNDLVSAFPGIQSGYDYGNNLLGDRQLSEEEKNKIEQDMDNLGQEFQILQKDINEEQDRLNALLSEAFAEDEKNLEKVKKWKDWRDKLNSKYKKTRGKFNKVKGQGIPTEPKKVQGQLELTRECSSDIAESVPEIQEAFQYANDLIGDKGVDSTDKEAMQKDVKEIGEGFKNLKLELNDYEKELESLSLKQEEEKADKIQRWEIWIIRIKELQDQCQEKAKILKSTGEPQNKKDVEEQMILAKECKEELEAAKPVIHEGLDYGKLLLDDDIIDDDVKTEIKKDVNGVEYNLEKMEKDNADEQGRLEVLVVQYDTDKKDKLDKWETWKVKLRSILALKRNHLNELKAEDPSEQNVEELLAKAKDCQDSLQSSEPEIKFALDYGEQLVDDDLTDPDEKQKIQEDVIDMEQTLKDLKEEAAKEKIRLEQIYVRQIEEKEQKLKQWEIWIIRITQLEKKCQEKLRDLKAKGEPKDKKDVDDQIILAKEFQDELQSAKPVITDGLDYGSLLLEDDTIDEDSKAKVKQDVEHFEGDLMKLEQASNDEQNRLEEALQEQGEERKLKNWENRATRIKELMSDCENKLADLKSKGEPKDRKDVEEQIILANAFEDQLQSSKPEISDGLGYGWLLLEDDVISSDNKASIRQDLHELEDDLLKLEQAKVDEQRWLEWLLLLRQGKEKEQKLKRWEIWVFWFNHRLGKCEEQFQNLKSKGDPKDMSEVEEQIMLTKECNDELQAAKPELSDALGYGWQLIDDSSIDDDNKETVKKQVHVMEENLLKVEQANTYEQRRLWWLVLLHEGKEKEQKLKRWEIWTIRIKDLMNKSETDLANLKSMGEPKNKQEIEEQVTLAKKCNDELQLCKPEISDGLAYGWGLTEDDAIDNESKANVKQDLNQLEDRLLKLEKANSKEQRRMEWLLLVYHGKHKEQKLMRWEMWTIRIKELLNESEENLASLKAKDEPKDRQDVEEHIILAKECKDELQASKPEISEGLAYGKELLKDDDVDYDGKANVKRDINQLEGDLLGLERANDEEVHRLQERLKAMDDEKEIMEDWREKCIILKSGMDAVDEKVQQGKKAKTPEEIEKCYIKLEDLTNGLAHTEPELNSTLDHGRKLASNDDLSGDSRQEISEDVVFLEQRWKSLTKASQDEYARLGVELGASQAKQRNLATWHERCDTLHEWVNDKYVRLRSRPSSPEASFGGIKRQQSVIEELVKDMVTKQGEVNEIIDEGNQIIEDNSMPEGERKVVHEKMIALHDDWNKLANLTSGKQQSVQVLLLEKEQQHLDKTQNWRRKIDPLMIWISSAENRLNTQFEIAPDLDTVKKQKNDLEDFNNEMLSHQREVSDTLQTGDKLLKDSELPEDDRTAIQKEVLDLSHRWENLEELVSWKSDRIDDTIQKLKIQQEDKLQKWHEGLEEVNGWVVKTRVKVESQTRLATDVDAALEQMDDFQEVIKDAPLYQEKVTYLNEFSSNLVSDPCLGEEERRAVREETAICNENWNDLVNLANARQARMEENLDKLERQEQDTLERWRIRSERSGLALDKLEGQISVIDDPIGNNLETVRRQEDAFEIFSNEVEVNTPQMIDTIALGEKVRKDPKLTQKRKDEVDEHLDSLTARWDRVKDFVALRKERLGEASKRLQRERRDKLHEWEERLSNFDSFLRKAERETERLEPIGDDLETVKRQNEDFEQSTGLLIGQQKRVYDFENFTDDLLTDPVMDEKSKQSMENDKDDRLERWARVVDKINNHQAKLQETLLSLEKSQGEFSRWNDQLETIQEEISKVESVCEQEIAPDLETLEKQRNEAKNLKEDVGKLDPKIDEFLKMSDSLLDENDLPEKDQERVESESELLEKRWNKIKNDANTREPRIEEQYLSLQKRQKDLLGEWKNSCNSTLKWIADASARLEAQDTTAPDLDHARAQRQEIEDLMREIKQYDKQMDKLDQLGENIVHEPSMRDLEKTLVTNEKASIIGRWEGLLSNTEAAKNRLDKQIEQLEKEQREKMKMWSEKTEPLDTWLVKHETFVESYEPIGYDISYVKGQREDAQAMITDLLHEQPKFAEMTDFGNQLTTEPCVGLEERVKIQKEMQSLHERWDGLYEAATSRLDRIQDRLKILEDEQRKMEEERKKLEEEEKQRMLEAERRHQEELERRRKEEEEKRKREEEARRRREEEERKRREEEERLRREEEEERRRKEEEERKRREEEARKRREEEERARREEEERRKREEEERKRREEEERKRKEEERKKREEEERKRREEEDRKRREEQERRKREQEERKKREEEERKRKEEEKRKQREEEERKRKEKERKRKEEEEEKRRREEEERNRKEAEEKRKREEEEKLQAIAYIAPEPRVQLVEQEPRLFSSPVEEVVVSIDENVVEAAAEPDGILLEGRLHEWKNEANEINAWLKDQDDKLPQESDEDSIGTLKEKEGQIASLEKELPVYDKRYHDLENDFEELMSDKNIKEDQQEEIGEDMDNLRGFWRSLNKQKDTKKNRIKKMIWDKEQKKAGELAGCRVNLQAVKDWIELRDKELESMDPIGNDLKTLGRQKEDLKQFSKRLDDYEPRFTEATDTAYKLCKDPAFSEEQNKALRQDAEDCETRWDDVLEKVKDRMDGIVKKIPKLQKDQKELLEEWKDRSARFDKSLKKTEEKLKEQISIGREIGFERRFSEIRSPELTKRQGENNNEWKPSVDESNASLRRVREKLQDIQREKKNRKWSIIEALKDVMHSITTRFRGDSKSGVHLDKVVDLLEDHEDIMTDTSSKQRDADEVFALGENALESGMLENDQANDVHDRMTDLNHRWNGLNIDVIEREKRLEQLAQDIESEYKRFDSWRDRCDNMNQWLTESEKLIKNEEKIGSDIEVLKEQINDNQLFLNEVKEYEPKVDAMLQESQELVDSSKLDKTDIDGVDKTKNALNSRWKAVNDHLKERQQKLDSALLDILKKDTEGRLGRWREQSIALGLLVSDATRKVEQDVDETDYGDIQASSVQLQEVENSLEEDLSRELVEVSDSGRDIIEKKESQPDAADEINETLDALNRQVADLEKGTREKKDKIKEASLKYFGRSLADCEEAVERLGETSVNDFTDVGSDIGEVGKQLVELQEFESELVKEEAKFSDIKDQFEDCKGTQMLREEDQARIQRRIEALDGKWAELNKNHDENHRKLTQAMIVLHEELMEEVYDWMGDAEKQADSIAVNEDDISSVMEEYGRHRELKEEISSFEPTFKKAIGISDRLLTERLVDPERAESYETEINSLEKRWNNLQLKTMDNGAKLSSVLGRYITTRLDDAEVTLTHAESSISRDDADYLDLEAAKKALDAYRVKKTGIHESQKKVDEILTESQAIVKEEFFKDHERDHFQGRIDMIDKRNKGLEEKAAKEERRMLDTYILLLKQHLQRMNVWLKMAESRIKQEGEIGPGYDDVKKQLEDHQVFQEELRDHSMISMILGVDVTDPDINESTQKQVKSLSDRWSKVWNWSEQRKTQLLKVLSNWQRFRDEQLILLNWLSSKEKILKDMGRTDLTDEDEVKEHLEKLRVIEKELDEQGIRLQSLHKAGEDLLKNVDEGDPAAKEINTQLTDFDDCWNDIAKQVINRIQQLETSQSKLNEFHSEMDATNEWMDDTEKLLKSFSVGMDPEEASKLQEKTEIKCEERSRYAAKVDRINRLGKDLAGEIDQPSHDAIQEELQPFNARWSDVSTQLENFSDKGYPQPGNECCLLRIMRRKFGVFQ